MSLVTRAVTLGGVELFTSNGDPLPPLPGSVVVGAAPQWSDGSLATYATTTRTVEQIDIALAPFESVASSAEVVRAVEVSAVISATADIEVDAGVTDALPGSGTLEIASFEVPGDSTPRTYTASLNPAVAAIALVPGGFAWFGWGQFRGLSATCYEFTLTVTLWDQSPPRRIFPRDDGLMGGAPRVFPPSKGYQSGNRAAGGYV